MKKILTLILIVGLLFNLQATNWVEISGNPDSQTAIQLVSSNISKTTLQLSLNGFWYTEVETEQGTAWELNVDGAAKRLEKGKPSLPLFASSVIIPGNSNMKIEVVNSSFVDYKDVLIAPSKGNFDRTIDPASLPYKFGPQYNRNEFFPKNTSSLRQPYIIRDFRGQTVLINPFSYNPVTKTLRVYYDITVQLTENGISNINTTADVSPEKTDVSFKNLYKRHFLNYQVSANRYEPVDEHGKMLIIAYGDFLDGMGDYIDWRTKTGTEVEMVDVATIGDAAAIKTYIANYYNDNGLTFVLLVGDAQQVPSSVIGGNDSDVDYSYVVGNDHYPDLFVGRFSAENTTHVATMVQRTIDYERYPMGGLDAAWFNDAIGIGSNDSQVGDDNEHDYEHIRNIQNNKLIPFTYEYAYELFGGSQGGEDEPGQPNPSQVAAAVNSGGSIINYTGHGSTTSWSTSGFSNNDINNLTNTDKLPFIISVACVNGNFVGSTCFGEAWTRAEDNGEPTGAVATIMSTINQSWNPPMRGQDIMNDILTELEDGNIKRTFGGITMNGCMGMNDAYGSNGDEMTDTWTIFGDPSIMVRTDIPQTMTVSHPATVFLGATTITVSCDVDDAIAALTMDGEIISTATVEGGSAQFVFMPLNDVGVMDLVITAFNQFPYEGTVEIVPTSGPYIVNAGNVIDDSNGNNNGIIDYTENILLTLDQTNVGIEDALNVDCSISTENEFITIADNTENYGLIAVEDTVSVENGFAFDVANNIPDGTKISFTITSENGNGKEIWESTIFMVAHAPTLNLSSFIIDDNAGNQNGRIDPGETVDLIVDITNNGSSESFNIIGNLTSSNQYITINTFDVDYGNMPGGDTVSGVFSVTADYETPEGTEAVFDMATTADFGINSSDNFATYLGQKPILIIDFANETGSATAMLECFAELNVGADQVTESFPTDIEIYQSVFIILGVYPNNHALSSEEGILLKQYLDLGGRIYMEGGDTWAFDEPTEVHAKFLIDGIDDGSDDLDRIVGEAENMLDGYGFNYDGMNSYIDRIGAEEGAHLIFSNENPVFGTAVSYENDVYKTIGSSACFGGLVDEEGGTNKDGLMAEYLYFFDINYLWTGIENNSIEESSVSAYPNPFNDFVNITLDLNKTQTVEISIYSLTGEKVETLVDEQLQIGNHVYSWDAEGVAAGIYFYSVKTGNQTITRKLVLTK